jgi:hypothetical protein
VESDLIELKFDNDLLDLEFDGELLDLFPSDTPDQTVNTKDFYDRAIQGGMGPYPTGQPRQPAGQQKQSLLAMAQNSGIDKAPEVLYPMPEIMVPYSPGEVATSPFKTQSPADNLKVDDISIRQGVISEIDRLKSNLLEGTENVIDSTVSSVRALSDFLGKLDVKALATMPEGTRKNELDRRKKLSTLSKAVTIEPEELKNTSESVKAFTEKTGEKFPELPKRKGVKGWVDDVVKIAPQIFTQVGAHAISGPAGGMLFMGSQILGGQYDKLVSEGVEPIRAFNASITNAVAQSALETVGMGKALSVWKPGKQAKKALREMAEVMGVEFFTEWMQSYPDAATEIWAKAEKENKSPSDQVDQFFKEFWETTKTGMYEGLVAAPYGGLSPAAKAAHDKISRLIEGDQLEDLDFTDGPEAISKEDSAALKKVETNPSDAQTEAGNYKKAHIKVDGFDLSIENPAGSTRSGVDASGKKWSQKMFSHYGYLKRSLGKDGDQVDVFVNPKGKEGKEVFVVDQVDPKTNKFDEHKVMIGYDSKEDAKQAYLSNYEDGWKGLGNISGMSQETFKAWLNDSKRTKKPIKEVEKKQGKEADTTLVIETNHPIYGKQTLDFIEEYKGQDIAKTDSGKIAVVSKDGETVFFPALDDGGTTKIWVDSENTVEGARKYLDWLSETRAKKSPKQADTETQPIKTGKDKPFNGNVQQSIEKYVRTKYKDLFAMPKADGDALDIETKIFDGVLTPEEFSKRLSVAPTRAKQAKSIIADQLGELITTHKYEGFEAGSEQEAYLDSLLAVVDKHIPVKRPGLKAVDSGSLSDKRIDKKYEKLLKASSIIKEDGLSHGDYQPIIDMARTPKALEKKINRAHNKDKYILNTEAAIADLLGDLHETYKYEGFKEGQAQEAYIDSLLEVIERNKISRDTLSDNIQGTGLDSKTGPVSSDRGIKKQPSKQPPKAETKRTATIINHPDGDGYAIKLGKGYVSGGNGVAGGGDIGKFKTIEEAQTKGTKHLKKDKWDIEVEAKDHIFLQKLDSMQQEVNSTHTRGFNQVRPNQQGEDKGYSANSPQWMQEMQAARKADKKPALTRKDLNALFNNIRSGKPLTTRQQDQFIYLGRAIEKYEGETQEFTAGEEAADLESRGFDPMGGARVSVANLKEGDKFVGTVDGVKDEFTVKDTNAQGETLLEDGIKKRVDMFEEVIVDGIKKGKKEPIKETQDPLFGDSFKEPEPEGQRDIFTGEATPDKKKPAKTQKGKPDGPVETQDGLDFGKDFRQEKDGQRTMFTPSGHASTGSFADIPISAMEMPEIVKLAKELLKGRYPKVARAIGRKLGVLGDFMPSGDGRIRIKADLFKDVQQAAKTLAHEIGHLVDYLDDKTMSRGNILGRIASLKKYMKKSMESRPGGAGPITEADKTQIRLEAQKLLGEKAEQWIDEIIIKETPVTPKDIMAIWNSVEGSINKDLTSFIKGLSSAQKKALVKEAMKGRVPDELRRFASKEEIKTGKKIKVLKNKERRDLEVVYKELIEAEIRKRQLLQWQDVQDELKAFTQKWKPFDPAADAKFTKYRFSSPELYADALSALITNPGYLRQEAPIFFEAFYNFLENKPMVKDIYAEIMATVNKTSLARAKTHINDIYEMFGRSTEKRNEAVQKDRVEPVKAKDELLNKFWDKISWGAKDYTPA